MNLYYQILLFFFLFIISFLSKGQVNLIPNPSFEDYSECSTSPLIQFLNNWFIPEGGGSSDYFNTCINPVWPIMGVPNNSFGMQPPRTGNGYCGFGTFEDGFDAKEYLRVDLIEELKPNRIYCLSFWLSLSDSSSYETDRVHAYFSSVDTPVFDDSYLLPNAQIEIITGFGMSTNDWVYFSGEFLAEGGEKFLTIGNFQQNNQIQYVFLGQNQIPQYAYYYIDDVSLTECGDFHVPNVFTPNGDGINDSLLIKGIGNQYIVQIYNRWGNEVFYTENPGIDTWTDESVTDGVYYLIIYSKKDRKVIHRSMIHVFH